jgi:tRNA threonylcarbamoyladenosine biosynthesis protein TsaE
MSESVISHSTEDLSSIAGQIIKAGQNVRVIAFTGELGAGKTTLIGNICKLLGVVDYRGSPPFSLVNEYELKKDSGIFHFDCYRIKNEIEILDIGWEDYLSQNKWIFIEWPEKVKNILPEHFLWVNIKVDSDKRRIDWKML